MYLITISDEIHYQQKKKIQKKTSRNFSFILLIIRGKYSPLNITPLSYLTRSLQFRTVARQKSHRKPSDFPINQNEMATITKLSKVSLHMLTFMNHVSSQTSDSFSKFQKYPKIQIIQFRQQSKFTKWSLTIRAFNNKNKIILSSCFRFAQA